MINLILYYLLAGTAVGFLLETAVRATNQPVTWGERISLIVLWPVMLAWFIINFIRGFFR
jgi:hypothetical protein